MLFNEENSREIQAKIGVTIGAGVSLTGSGHISAPSLVFPGQTRLADVTWGGCVILEPPISLENVQIGCHVRIGRDFSLFSEPPRNWLAANPLYPGRRMPGVVVKQGPPTVIGADCWIGPSVMIKAGITIGEGSFIAAGAILAKDVPPFSVVRGSRVTSKRLPEKTAERAMRLHWYDYDWQNVPLDWAHPDRALDEIERRLEAGEAKRFTIWQYEDSGSEKLVFSRMTLQ